MRKLLPHTRLKMEPVVGIEPTTDGLQNRCSTAELNWLKCLTCVPGGTYFGRVKADGKLIRRSLANHHDLRHLFATRCIENGVDIPTVSRWLGHQDGGALCMKTYGHLRGEHSANEARKVAF